MFARDCRLPIDLVLGTREELDEPFDWLSHQHRRLTEAYELAREQMKREADRRKRLYDQRAKDHLLSPGDRVFLRKRVPGRNKIQDVWGTRVYKVLHKQGDNAVYTVQPADGFGTTRTINRSDLRLCQGPHWEPHDAVPRRKTRTRKASTVVSSSGGSSDEQFLVRHISPHMHHVAVSNPDSDSPPQADIATSDEEHCDVPLLRRSSRVTAGLHSNPHHMPRSIIRH